MWYEHSTWRNLIDMHIPDWKDGFLKELSVSEYVDALEKSGADTALVYAGSCLGICYWPTGVGHMHRGLEGRDFIGGMMRELKARGIRPVIYYNIWSRWAYDTHPEWRIRTIDGYDTCHTKTGPSRFGQVCLNSPGYQEYVRRQITDLCENYDCAGLWIDMLGWFDHLCCCPDCRRRFMDETGMELPETIDWRDPVFVRFQRCREKWMAGFARMVRESAKKVRPDMTVTIQCASWQGGWGRAATQAFLDQSDYLAGDFYCDPLTYSVICKYLNNVTRNRPIEFMVSRCVDLSDHTTTKTDAELLSSARGAFAHQAAFVYIDAIDPCGTVNARFHEHMGRLRKQLNAYEQHVSHTARLVSDVALYFNLESAIDPEQNGTPFAEKKGSVRTTEHMKRLARAMVDAHIAYDMIGQPQLSRLSDWPAIVLSEQYVLSDEEAEAFRKYVADGGQLLVSGGTGIYSPEGMRNDFALADVLGLSYEGAVEQNVAYMAPTDAGAPYFEDFDRKYPLFVPRRFIKTRSTADIDVLARVTLPVSSTDEIRYFGSAISDPPMTETEIPAVSVHRYGKGEATYLAAALGKEEYGTKRKIYAALVGRMLPERRVYTEAPAWLEILVWRDEAKESFTVTAMNTLADVSGLIARGVKVRIACDRKVRAVVSVEKGEKWPFVQADGYVSIDIPECIDFTMADVLMENKSNTK